MPRFFAQAQQQALADKRKAFAVPDSAMKSPKDQGPTSPTAVPNGLQGAIAQMESNAAAAMARFKSFRAASAPAKEELEPTPSMRSEDIPESPTLHLRSDSAPPPEAPPELLLGRASRFAALELAARQCIRGEKSGRPWHHELHDTPWQWLSTLLDQPGPLLAAAAACIFIGSWDWLGPLLLNLLTMQRVSTAIGMCCLLLAISGWLLRTGAFMQAQASAFADTIPRMPRACQEMTEMLKEMKLMRHDLKSMRAKVAWLPGGE